MTERNGEKIIYFTTRDLSKVHFKAVNLSRPSTYLVHSWFKRVHTCRRKGIIGTYINGTPTVPIALTLQLPSSAFVEVFLVVCIKISNRLSICIPKRRKIKNDKFKLK